MSDEFDTEISSCPEGWEVKKLGEILRVKRGKRLVRRELSTRGLYPVYQNSLAPLGFFESYNCDAQSAFIIAAGNAGEVGYSNTAFWAADDCFYFTDCKDLHQKFLYYTLLHNQFYIYSQTRRTSIPRLSQDVVANMLIPFPPLHEQQAIADTLTVFDTHITNLAELIAKKKAIRDGAL
ncbi:MAG: restriction endonuclease subunit S, partial [Synergistaceae bacterium]|nr:restriction endonuclease subunit S [Synergistaceae bacterium]